MVVIKKNGKEMIVPKSSYKEYFKHYGWEAEDEKEQEVSMSSQMPSMGMNEEDEDMENEKDFSYLNDKPIDEMTGEEVKEFAKMKGISIKDKKKKEVIEELKKLEK